MIKSDSPNFPLFYLYFIALIYIFAFLVSLENTMNAFNECSAFQFLIMAIICSTFQLCG